MIKHDTNKKNTLFKQQYTLTSTGGRVGVIGKNCRARGDLFLSSSPCPVTLMNGGEGGGCGDCTGE